MKFGVISQRVDTVESYSEVRDALDEKWHEFFARMNSVLVPLPNFPENILGILERLKPDFIVLSGGNNPERYGGTAPQRDEVDEIMINYSIENHVPLLGVCRGMQSVALHWNSTLKKVDGHIATKHSLSGMISRVVNSFHGFAIDQLADELEMLAESDDGNIESIRSKDFKIPIYGIMWHPERVKGFDIEDMRIIKEWMKL